MKCLQSGLYRGGGLEGGIGVGRRVPVIGSCCCSGVVCECVCVWLLQGAVVKVGVCVLFCCDGFGGGSCTVGSRGQTMVLGAPVLGHLSILFG